MGKIKDGLAATIIVTFMASLAALLVAGGIQTANEEKAREKARLEAKEIVRRVYTKAAGDDRILSTEEKRRMLDSLGLDKAVLQEGQDIYYRVRQEPNSAELEYDIVLGYNLENNGGFLVGSRAKSGTVVGRVSGRDLASYLTRDSAR